MVTGPADLIPRGDVAGVLRTVDGTTLVALLGETTAHAVIEDDRKRRGVAAVYTALRELVEVEFERRNAGE